MTKYVINEHFMSFQGEGVHAGKRAYFVRLHGCDQSCPWCDSAGTWHPDFKTDHPRMTADAIVRMIDENLDDQIGFARENPIVIITGGEPTLYDLTELSYALKRANYNVHLETAGHRPIRGAFDWITLSPKPFAAGPLPENVGMANEFKFIIDSWDSFGASMAAIDYPTLKQPATIWLHPEWSKRSDPEILKLICDMVKDPPPVGAEFRAGWQMHKLYSVDQMDKNADLRVIPLGGDSSHEAR